MLENGIHCFFLQRIFLKIMSDLLVKFTRLCAVKHLSTYLAVLIFTWLYSVAIQMTTHMLQSTSPHLVSDGRKIRNYFSKDLKIHAPLKDRCQPECLVRTQGQP